MKIRLNGEEYSLPDQVSILGLITHLELEPKKVAVERNLEIVPKSCHSETMLQDGDSIEIVEFVGGG